MLAHDDRVTTRAHPLTERQQHAIELARAYYAVAQEPAPVSWIARRMGFSRQRARDIRDTLQRRGQWLDR